MTKPARPSLHSSRTFPYIPEQKHLAASRGIRQPVAVLAVQQSAPLLRAYRLQPPRDAREQLHRFPSLCGADTFDCESVCYLCPNQLNCIQVSTLSYSNRPPAIRHAACLGCPALSPSSVSLTAPRSLRSEGHMQLWAYEAREEGTKWGSRKSSDHFDHMSTLYVTHLTKT